MTTAAAAWRRDRAFYITMSILVVVSVLAGFARTYFLRPYFWPNTLPPYIHVHGAAFTTWIALFAVQIVLIASRRTDVHRRLGWVAAGLAALMIPVALTAAVFSGQRNVLAGNVTGARIFLAVPVFSMIAFLILAGAAVYYRQRPETHKRLMLLATINILDAAIARWPLAFISSTTWMYYVVTDLFIVAAVVYDYASRRRLYAAYAWGGLLVIGMQAGRELIGRTAAWQSFARLIVG
jgi:hypothetical protein